MTHARIPDFSESVPVRPTERRAARAVALDLDPRALKPVRITAAGRALVVVGELLAAAMIVGGGMVLIGLASFF